MGDKITLHMLTPWKVRLLGDFRAERGHQVVTRFRSRATMALFAYLCLHPGRLFSREELADRFWPDADVDAGRASLRVALNSLKRALEPPPAAPGSVIEATRDAIRLRPEAVIVDVREFEKAIKERRTEDALALYGGDFLPGFWEDWIIDEQGRLQGLRENLSPQPPPPVSRKPGTLPGCEGGGASADDKPSEFPLSQRGTSDRERGLGGEVPNNLPLTLDAFFGREAELAQAAELLQTSRLVVLRGPGGMGKTRTALEVARGGQGFPGGVWFVPLADVLDPRRIPGAIAEAMGLAGGSEPLAGITERALVILDNLEQLGSSVGAEVERLLARVPALVVLATSRARLGVRGERVITLGALPLPEAGEALGELARRPAVALFADRARAASTEFGLTERNAGAVTLLCQKLEGLPLAIELAAAWAGVLTPARMLEKFEQRLALEAKKPDREARHLSLRAAIGWSVELLTPELRGVFYALSVFRGGFVAEVAGEVAAFEGIEDGLSRLLEQSLLTADLSGEVARFSLPEAIREFAEEHLLEETRERHAAWALREGDAVRLGIEEDANVRAALAFFSERKRPGDFMRLTGRYAFTWFRAGHLKEGEEALEAALALDAEGLAYADRLPVYRIRGAFRHYQQDAEGALRAADDCIRVAGAQGDDTTVATMMMDRATTMLIARRFPEVRVALSEVLPRLKALGRLVDVDTCLHNIAICALEQGEVDVARASLTEALAISRQNLSPGVEYHIGLNLNMLARLARYEGDLDRAAALQEEAEAQLRDDDHRFYLWFVLIDQAVVRALQGRFSEAWEKLAACHGIQKASNSPEGWLDLADTMAVVRALSGVAAALEARLLGATGALRESLGIRRYSQEEADVARARATIEAALGELVFQSETESGAAWSLDTLARTLSDMFAG